MTTLQPELQAFRHELRAAVDADLARHHGQRRRIKRAVAIGTPGGLAVLGLSLAMVLGAGSGPSPADAAILASAQGALTPPPNTVFHVAATITVGSSPGQHYELWSAGSSYRLIKFGYEAASNGTASSSYDAASNTLYVDIYNPQNHPPVDTAATIRSLISSGQAQVSGSAVVDGIPAYVLSLSGLPAGSGLANATYDVAQSDYHPLLIQGTVPCAQNQRQCTETETETVQFQTYEYLPETSANLSLLDLSAQHPGARVVNAGGVPGVGTSFGND
jgi:hypothetical protein